MIRAVTINMSYLVEHAEDIINNTKVLFPYEPWCVARNLGEMNEEQFILKQIERKQLHESGNWYIFGRGDRWIRPGENCEEADDRIVREYCEATGHWDLFIWKDVDPSKDPVVEKY